VHEDRKTTRRVQAACGLNAKNNNELNAKHTMNLNSLAAVVHNNKNNATRNNEQVARPWSSLFEQTSKSTRIYVMTYIPATSSLCVKFKCAQYLFVLLRRV